MAKKYNCTKNGYNYFRKTKKIGSERKEFYGNGEKDAERQIEEYSEKFKSGLNVKVNKLTIEIAMYQWLFEVLLYSKDKKSASFDKHECNYRNYVRGTKIGNMLVQNAVSLPFQQYYNSLYEKGMDIIDTKTSKIKHTTVSSDKIFDINKTLRLFFNYCISQHYTLDNPCSMKNIEIPGNADGEEDEAEIDEGNNIQAFLDAEMEIIKSNLNYKSGQDNTFNVAIQLDLITGLRLGELLGMKKKFLIKYIAKVRNTLKRVKIFDSPTTWHRETKLIRPKSNSSVRNVHFPIPFWKIVELYYKEQEEKWRKNGLEFNDDCLVFTTETCRPIDMTNFSRAWKRFLERIGLNYKKPHSIRDTYATTLIRRGALIHDVKDLLGHSSIKITEKYYIFVFPDDKSKVASLIDDMVVM